MGIRDRPIGRREEVTLLNDNEPLRAAVAHPEDPGPFACPPLAGLVTAGGRLLLAMLHRLVADKGGLIAACDTDGAYIVSTETGGTVCVETRSDEYWQGGPAEPVHALSWAEVEEIAARFEPLNPFDSALLPGPPLRVKGASEGLFISAKRYSLTRPDGSYVDYKRSILGILQPPSNGWIEEAWRTLGEMWDARPLTHRLWFDLPAVRSLAVSSPAYAREIKGLCCLRPWNFFLVATAIGQHRPQPCPPREPELPIVHEPRLRSLHRPSSAFAPEKPRSAIATAPFERDPERWATLPWRFTESGEPVSFDKPDGEGFQWRLRTLRDFLSSYARHPIPEMLALDGSRCRPYTRGVLLRRPVRDGGRWVLVKAVAVYGDDPRHAFSVPPPETVRQRNPADRDDASAVWERAIKPALATVGPAAVARKMGLAARSARAWAAGQRRPERPREVAHAIVAVACEAGLGLPGDDHLRAEEICGELPGRPAAVQCFASVMIALLAERAGGIRVLARAMAGSGQADLEPTVRRWLALGRGELRPIADLNRVAARLAKFSRAEIKKMHRRMPREPGPAGDRQAILAHLSLVHGAEKPAVLAPAEMLALPAALVVTALFPLVCQVIRPILEALPRTPI
jgi:hypothetical protein